ncbi:MAG: segregation/condensation protein A [Candidatus Bathyarchaeia archaeon]|nr:segregation/condensation protein A [Candidatus Bathyarchaeota archaeon]
MSEIRPFYLRPPWDILFDPQRLQRVDPWSINIAFLLLSFLEEMERRAIIDFRASGVALDSSALIYLLKSNFLLRFERSQPQGQIEPKESTRSAEVVPVLLPPLRYELTTTTLESLLTALEEALQHESSVSLKVRDKPVLAPSEFTPIISAFLLEIEEMLEGLFKKICMLHKMGETVTFSSLIKGLSKIEAIKTFIILLFLAHRGKISLLQTEDSDEIYIAISSGE